MWSQGCSQAAHVITSSGETLSHKATSSMAHKAHLEIFPCTVSQLLTAPQLCNDCFTICDCELNQVSVVGVIRGFAPFVTNVQYAVDDMTGPPLNVKLWVNMEDSAQTTASSPGMYVKVIGSLRSYSGQRSLLAMNVRRIKDLNEISSHMLEVVQAHMQVSRKVFDVNMNTTVASQPDWNSGTRPRGVLPNGLSTVQGQVLHQIQVFSVHNDGISFHDLTRNLDYISMRDIRSSLAFLASEGHIFSTIDEHHFKAA
ncbi:replication protein A 32 kDa subunit-like isoform X2 [Poecilia reticulata]|uniref:replication protein A 32 kDa subunit-like isoform X2 n=1 Tax=Poecilia reticulata TaxID=8081 RepID=UPI0004A3C84B|nr:PREDICTED: replication protein A 32 kDa subunit-like isoform X2 [Poecilia reticulata]